MPNVAKDGQPLYERAQYVYEGSDWVPMVADVDGHLITSDLWTYGSLAAGQLTGAEADLYTVPAATEAAGLELHLFNTHVSTLTVYLFVQRSGGTSFQLLYCSIVPGDSLLFGVAALSAGDKLRGYAGTTAKINYTLLGATR